MILGVINRCHQMNWKGVLSALLTLLLTGCVLAWPLSEDKVLTGRQLTDEQMVLITPKVTTKQQIIESLGTPRVIWEDTRVFVYDWDVRIGYFVFFAGGPGGGFVGAGPIPKHYLFLVQFDENDRVRRAGRVVRSLFESQSDFLIEWLGSDLADPSPASGL